MVVQKIRKYGSICRGMPQLLRRAKAEMNLLAGPDRAENHARKPRRQEGASDIAW